MLRVAGQLGTKSRTGNLMTH